MLQTVTIKLEKPICSAWLVDVAASPGAIVSSAAQSESLEQQKQGLDRTCQALQEAVNKVNEFHESIFRDHRNQIAKLSVEIARKILAQKVESGDYRIESIVQESLSNVPDRRDVVVHLNPEDLAQYEAAGEVVSECGAAGVKLVGDANIGRGECLLETPKGIIESFIDEQIERIGEELKKVE